MKCSVWGVITLTLRRWPAEAQDVGACFDYADLNDAGTLEQDQKAKQEPMDPVFWKARYYNIQFTT